MFLKVIKLINIYIYIYIYFYSKSGGSFEPPED